MTDISEVKQIKEDLHRHMNEHNLHFREENKLLKQLIKSQEITSKM